MLEYLDNQEVWFDLLQWKGWEKHAPGWLQETTASKHDFLDKMDILLDYSLIEKNDFSDTFSMHNVVHDWIRKSLNKKEAEGLLEVALTTIGLAVSAADNKNSWRIEGRLLLHVNRCTESWGSLTFLYTEDEEVWLAGLNNLGKLYWKQSRLGEAAHICQRALEGAEKALGPDHTSTLDTVNNLGLLYADQGKLAAEAEQMYQRSLKGAENALGPDHTSTLQTVNNLGALYRDQGKLAEVEQMY
ncbi:hypothetical protein BGZ60DRAFT_257741 [Tricladium varicosporioides]|nr:hypothetical protein BGZ60DRAFT_257741 [Hymenoscyphus varicosporioides]